MVLQKYKGGTVIIVPIKIFLIGLAASVITLLQYSPPVEIRLH